MESSFQLYYIGLLWVSWLNLNVPHADLTWLLIYLSEESATSGAEGESSEKVPVENSDQPSDVASPSEEPKQALSLVCDE